MNQPDLSKLSDREKASYTEGLKILEARRKTFPPSAQELHARKLREGQATVKRKLENASSDKFLEAAGIDIRAIAHAARKEYARSTSKPKKREKTALEKHQELTHHKIFCAGAFVGCKIS